MQYTKLQKHVTKSWGSETWINNGLSFVVLNANVSPVEAWVRVLNIRMWGRLKQFFIDFLLLNIASSTLMWSSAW